MGPTRLTYRLPRWLWVALAAALLLGLVATTAVTTSLDPTPPEPTADEPTARGEIVGGRAARAGEYPFAVALLRPGATGAGAPFCGGSLIGPDLVLTAAHCVAGDPPDRVDALVGTHDLLADGRRIRAEAIHVHPGYDPATSSRDVAVVRLRELAPSPTLVRMATATPAPGTPSTVIGWGTTKTDGYPTTLQTVDVPLVSDAGCQASYGRKVVADTMVCAGHPGGGQDACTGDSGGPLLVAEPGGWVQVGLVSWGYGCALPDLPGVYAEVAALRDFLDPYLIGFRDLPAWAADAITWLAANDYATGFPDRTFRPDATLTRAQAVRILYRIVSRPQDAVTRPAHAFSDVPAWIEYAVDWAAHDPDGGGPAASPMSGYPDGTFRPDALMTRAQFSRLLWRLAGSPAAAGHPFSDVGPWVHGAVSWMAAENLATGWPDGTFRPDGPLTRAQASRMLYRIHADL
jgi:hypothetical protein